MTTRREFIRQSVVAGAMGAALVQNVKASGADQVMPPASGTPSESKHPQIKALVRRDDTILRSGGCGGVVSLTWGADDRQFLVQDDGTGFDSAPKKVSHSRMFAVSGNPPNHIFQDILGYPDMPLRMKEADEASFWGAGCLAVGGLLFQFLSTSNHPYYRPDMTFFPDFSMVGSKLIYSSDNGRTWHNQDGSSPVVWEKWEARSKANMTFFNEDPAGAFAGLNVLQMGRNYELNKDGYVYVYSMNGNVDGSSNQLVMFRVHKSRICDRRSYEFFAGMRLDGNADWSRDIASRAVVHTFPRGWANDGIPAPAGWGCDVVYNAPLSLYMMVGSAGGSGSEPSCLGFWVAPTPWGPFTQIHQELAWTPAQERAARAMGPLISPKWISRDGKSFWLIWEDIQYRGSSGWLGAEKEYLEKLKGITDQTELARATLAFMRENMPYGTFNAQRVDIQT